MISPKCGGVFLAGLAVGWCGALPARGVTIYGGSGNNFVSPTAPVPDSIAGHSLDQYVGTIEGFLGTPISSRYFVTANHITGNTTDTFTYANGTGVPTAYPVQFVGNEDDLAIWEISPSDPTSFSLFAPLDNTTPQQNAPLVVLGNGTTRGAAVTVNGVNQGWYWGPAAAQTSWGDNTVAGILTAGQDGFTTPNHFGGQFLQFTFNPNPADPNEAIITSGDSGGPVFVFNADDNSYELAGVNSLVDQVEDSSGNAVLASLYDDSGFYYTNANNQVVAIPADETGPLSSYATLISSRIGYIDSVTGVPEPASVGVLGLACAAFVRRRRS